MPKSSVQRIARSAAVKLLLLWMTAQQVSAAVIQELKVELQLFARLLCTLAECNRFCATCKAKHVWQSQIVCGSMEKKRLQRASKNCHAEQDLRTSSTITSGLTTLQAATPDTFSA
jgi:hypothetical protein